MAEAARLVARVTGRVQGVGFRHFVRTHAQRLALTGWVRNDPDGAVSLVAEGPRPDLDTFLSYLQRGPSVARVDHVSASWVTATNGFAGFDVRFF